MSTVKYHEHKPGPNVFSELTRSKSNIQFFVFVFFSLPFALSFDHTTFDISTRLYLTAIYQSHLLIINLFSILFYSNFFFASTAFFIKSCVANDHQSIGPRLLQESKERRQASDSNHCCLNQNP